MIDDMTSPELSSLKSKKEYRTPALTDYGSVANLTRLDKMFKSNEGNTKCNDGSAGYEITCPPLS